MRETMVRTESSRSTANEGDLLRSQREEAAAIIARVRREDADVTTKHLALVATAEATFLKAKAAHDDAARELQKARAELAAINHETEVRVGECEKFLIETAPPEIDVAIDTFQAAMDEFRRHGRIERFSRPSTRPSIPWPQSLMAEGNLTTVRVALAYCRNAIASLQALKVEVALDPRKIQELITGVSALEV